MKHIYITFIILCLMESKRTIHWNLLTFSDLDNIHLLIPWSLPPPLPSTDPPPPHSTNGRNSRLAFLDHISASESSVSSKHSSSTASLASHGSNNDALPVLCNRGLVNQGFKQEEEVQERETKEDRKECLRKVINDIPHQNHEKGL